MLARVLLAQGRPRPALELLGRQYRTAAAQGRVGSVIEIRALQALAASGKEADAVDCLAGALTLACPQGYVLVFADEGPPMSTLLGRPVAAQKADQGAARAAQLGCLAQVLRAFASNDAADTGRAVATAVPGLVEQLTARELEILVLLAAGTANPRIAEELVVTLDTVKARQPRPGQARRGQPHRGGHPGPPAGPDPLARYLQPIRAGTTVLPGRPVALWCQAACRGRFHRDAHLRVTPRCGAGSYRPFRASPCRRPMRLAEETTDEARTRCTRGGLTHRQRTGAHMLNGNARDDRTPLTGGVDFTMMYAAHDAFTRDLQRLAAAAGAGQTADPAVKAGWAMFKKQLHIHHTAEDRSLWPPLREKVTRPEQVAVLDAMQAEHARIDPQLDAVDQALAASDAGNLTRSVGALADGLTGHMRHEENAALPLVETFLGPEGWDAFGRAIRKTQGLRAGAEYLPWVLDGAPIATQAKVLALLPPPVRLLYRLVWAPKYRRIARWDGHASV